MRSLNFLAVLCVEGFNHRSQPSSIDLNSVRLCFQVFLENPERERTSFTIPLRPVVSEPIYDKKAMSDLVICKLSDAACSVAGGREIILLCEKVCSDIIHFTIQNDQIIDCFLHHHINIMWIAGSQGGYNR